MYRLPIEFAATLPGKSCFISRVKHNIEQPSAEFPFFTLHSIVGKIIKKGEKSSFYTSKFSGEDTFNNVKKAVKSVTDSTLYVHDTYYKIRAHKNKSFDIRTEDQGAQYLYQYQSHLEDGIDWDDSMQTATWMLKNSPISSLNNFPYQNIILIQPELLGQARNHNAKEFFKTWCEWIEDYTNWNIYIVDNKGNTFQLNNGKLQNIKSSVSNGTLLSF